MGILFPVSPLLAAEKNRQLIAWGGVGRFGLGGYGYGRLLRMGVRGVNRGYGRRGGRFSHNHNRVNRMNRNSQRFYQGGQGYQSSLNGRAGNRFNNRHQNNELWNQRGWSQNPNQQSKTLWGQSQGQQGGNLWGQSQGYRGSEYGQQR